MPKDTEGNDVTSVTVSQKGGTEDGTDVPFGFGKVNMIQSESIPTLLQKRMQDKPLTE